MKSTASAPVVDAQQSPDNLTEVAHTVGSAAFKWALKGILGIVGATLAAGALYLSSKAASYNPDVMAAKSDVDVLKTDFKVLKATADDHTLKLTQAELNQQRSTEVQGKIFDAIKQLSADVHTIDVHVATVDQKVDDLKSEQRR